MSINNSGVSSVLVNLFSGPGFNYAVLNSSMGTDAFLAAGSEQVPPCNPDYQMCPLPAQPGSVTVPSADYVYDNGYWTSINNNGDIAFSIRLRSSVRVANAPLTGAYFNKSALPVKTGDTVTAAGVAPGTTFGNFSGAGMVKLNDNNVVMIAGPIVEGGITKNAIIKATLNSSGALLSETLVAKEGGPVGGGPATWTFISVAPPTCDMNNSGDVIFSGVTSTNVDGIFLNNAFVATKGGAGPSSQTWASLYASPLDLANSGQFAFRGLLQGSPVWAETSDAGEGMNNANGGGTPLTAQFTSGGGSLGQVNGTLSNDQDVDLYLITIDGGPTNTPFSATTVPDAGSGFAGANFDSVLYLFKYLPNMNFNTRAGVGRCDDAAPGVMQSSLTTASLPTTHTPGDKYILGVSTPKARAWSSGWAGGGTPTQEMWMQLPSRIAVGSTSGMVFWPDVANGQIARSGLSSSTLLSPLGVINPPAQANELQQLDPASALLGDMIAVYDAGASSKVFFFKYSYVDSKIMSCNTDGTGVTEVINNASGLPLNTGRPNAYATNALAVDSVNQALYWSNSSGKINKSALDGSGNAVFVTQGGNESITALAVDTKTIGGVAGTGRIFWYNATAGAINRCRFDGTSIQSVISVPEVTSMTIDPVGRRLYYTANSGNVIHVIGVDAATVYPDLVMPTGPVGISFDPGAGNVYWSTPAARMLQRSSISSPSIQNWTSIGADIGERPTYGDGAFDGFAGFVRNGTAGSTPLPYSIKLTGATFAFPSAMICRNNTVNVDGGISGLAPGGPTVPVCVSDSGVVVWSGNGLYVDQTQIINSGLLTIGGTPVGQVYFNSPLRSLAASDNCQHILVGTYNGNTNSGYQGVGLLQVDFDSPPTGSTITCCRGATCATVAAGSCPANGTIPGVGSGVATGASCTGSTYSGCCYADFDKNGLSDVNDIFIYLNAWFSSSPFAKVGGDGVALPSVNDIFMFLNAWFGGCTP